MISRTTAMAYRDTTLTLTEIARELKVDAILEGAALRQDNRVRVTARLIRGDSESLLWSDSYDRDLGDVLTLMGEVARDLAGAVRVVLTPEETGRFAVDRRIDPKALDLYLRGRHLWYGGTVESSRAAIAMFEEAIAVAPSYALAYAGLADAYPALYYSGELSAEEAFGQSRLHALRSIELDDSLAEAYASLTRVSLELDWDWESAAVSIRRALEFNPNYAVAHHWLGWYFATVGRFEAAIEQIDRAHQLDPLSLRISGDRVRFTYLARRYDEAIEAANALLASDPRLRTPRRFLGRAYLEIGRFDEAVLELERAAGSGSPLIVLSDLAHAYAVSGKTEEASQMLDRLLERDPPPAFSVALVHLGLGRREQSLDWLERAYAERSTRLRSIKGDPRLDPLRLEPRFLDLLRRMKLDDAALAD